MTIARDHTVPILLIRETLFYDPKTGALTWVRRVREHFRNDIIRCSAFNERHVGKRADKPGYNGYREVRFTIEGRQYRLKASRVAYALMIGAWPQHEIDHADGDRGNNKWSNLRPATRAEQMQNRVLGKRNSSGHTGVSPHQGKWRAMITVNRRRHHLGCFKTPEEAAAAYLAGKARMHPFQPAPHQ
jgi:hypothetical protein